MKKKTIERLTPPVNRKRKAEWNTILQWLDQVVIFNIYIGRTLKCRHCFDTVKKEYATYYPIPKIWTNEKIERCYGEDYSIYHYDIWNDSTYQRMKNISKEDEETLRDMIPEEYWSTWRHEKTIFDTISRLEREYGQERREITEKNRIDRIKATMAKVPPVPAGILSWIDKQETGHEDVCLKVRKENKWSCSACGKKFKQSALINAKTGEKAKNKDMIVCPKCGKAIKLYTRKQRVESLPHFSMIQPIDDEISVARHFSADICCLPGKKKEVSIVEDARIILFKNEPLAEKKRTCSICFDNKSNPANKREYIGYLYDGGIEEAFKRTVYEPWTKLFREMSAAGLSLNYNAMMCGVYESNYIRLIEMLFRGRFTRLLQEESMNISYWTSAYCGRLRLNADSIEDVFGIADRQKINRIRDRNGGNLMVEWMQWSERNHQKITDKALTWLMEGNLEPRDMQWTKCRFSIEQAMNYMIRQRRESYPKRTIKGVIEQYEDYMRMCEKLKKDTTDEMVYRPRELKRRHDEAVVEIEFQEAQIKADEYSKKYSEAEHVLQEIKDKFEYKGEQYFIMVPNKIVDIVTEGRCLHHCAGATDRYFDRIKQNETYICFLRKTAEPQTPYYTIEVEPGGTIRQHRGYMDEEPEIEKIKPFLKEWQKEIRARMSEHDHKLAEISKVKREENIEDLKQKNNTRVLKGLMEDFMEAAV